MDGPDDSDQTEHENPSWIDIETAIRSLDGDTRTLLVLGIGDPPVPHMAIAGGEEGQYIVYTTLDNMIFHKLIKPEAPPGKCLLVAGGQRGEYDRKMCVGLFEAIRAAKTYCETGKEDPSLVWQKNG